MALPRDVLPGTAAEAVVVAAVFDMVIPEPCLPGVVATLGQLEHHARIFRGGAESDGA